MMKILMWLTIILAVLGVVYQFATGNGAWWHIPLFDGYYALGFLSWLTVFLSTGKTRIVRSGVALGPAVCITIIFIYTQLEKPLGLNHSPTLWTIYAAALCASLIFIPNMLGTLAQCDQDDQWFRERQFEWDQKQGLLQGVTNE